MKISFLTVLASASASSTLVGAWSCAGGPSRFYSPSASMMMSRRQQRAIADRMLKKTERLCEEAPSQSSFSKSSSSRYDLVDDETKFELSIDVPGIKMEDIDIILEDGGYLSVKGERFNPDMKFSQTYSLDESVIVDKISATLDSGVLVVKAPKDMTKPDENIRKIPIQTNNNMESKTITNTVSSVETPSVSISESKVDKEDKIGPDKPSAETEGNDEDKGVEASKKEDIEGNVAEKESNEAEED